MKNKSYRRHKSSQSERTGITHKVGLGKSGMAAFELLEKMQANVCLYDGREDLDTSEYKVPVYLGDIPEHISIVSNWKLLISATVKDDSVVCSTSFV